MSIPFTTKTTESGPTPRKYAKAYKQINIDSAIDLGQHFHQVNLPRRFTVSGGRMLGYSARTQRYQRSKKRSKGHNNPLVWSGDTRRDVLGSEDVRATGTSKRWKVAVVLRARNLNRFKSKNVDVADEIRRVAAKEEPPLLRVFQKAHDSRRDQIR